MSATRAISKSSSAKRPHNEKADLTTRTSEELRRFSLKKAANAHLNLKRILVPVDFSRESAKAMQYAVTLARQFDASVTLVHVVEPAYGPPELTVGASDRRISDRKRLAKAKCKLGIIGRRILGPCRIVETMIRSGLAFFEITEAAKALASDLIVVGTHGYGGVTRSVMGSTAEKVIRHAPCPVLVVRPNEHEFIE